MAAGGIKSSQDVLTCPQMTGHGALDPRYRWCAMSKKVTPFRRPSPMKAETPIDGRIVFEVGADRFAIDYAITELNQKPAQVIRLREMLWQRYAATPGALRRS